MVEKITAQKMAQHISQDKLITLLPHKGKMFLLSRVTHYDEEIHSVTAEYDITKDCVFYSEKIKGVPSWVSFELLAQTVSSLNGIMNKNEGKTPRPGFILSITNFKAEVPLFREGTTVKMEIQENYNANDVYKYSGKLYSDSTDIPTVTTDMTVMPTDNIIDFFGEKNK